MTIKVHALICTPRSREHVPGVFSLDSKEQPFLGQPLELPGIGTQVPVIEFGNLAPDHIAVKTFRDVGRGTPNEYVLQTTLGIAELRKLGWQFFLSAA